MLSAGQVLVDEARNPVDVNDSSDITYQRGRDLLLEAALGGSMEAETTLGVLAYEQGDFILANEWYFQDHDLLLFTCCPCHNPSFTRACRLYPVGSREQRNMVIRELSTIWDYFTFMEME